MFLIRRLSAAAPRPGGPGVSLREIMEILTKWFCSQPNCKGDTACMTDILDTETGNTEVLICCALRKKEYSAHRKPSALSVFFYMEPPTMWTLFKRRLEWLFKGK